MTEENKDKVLEGAEALVEDLEEALVEALEEDLEDLSARALRNRKRRRAS